MRNKKHLDSLLKENIELEKKKQFLEKSRDYLKRQLDKIYSAKAFKIWQIFLLMLQKIKDVIPFSIRRRIKKIYFKYSKKQISHIPIPKSITSEWNKWFSSRKENSIDFLIFGVTSFHYRFQRIQHIATLLAKMGHRVFYIENEFIYSNLKDDFQPIMVEKEDHRLYLVKLASSVNYFIYSDKPKAEDVKRMFGSIKTLIKEARIVNPVVIITHPFWGNLLKSLAMPIIYDYIDYHQGFKENTSHLDDLEEKLFKESKLVSVTSKFLKDIVEKRRQEGVIMIPNAGEFSFFNKAMQNLACPSDLKTIRKPIIGYYGAIAEWLDVDLVEVLLKTYSRYSFVFIGRVNNVKVKNLKKKYKNLHLLGEKPYKELPYYLKYFDVCLIPFKNIPLIEATDPVKLYEYLSAGKPVVTSWIPEVLKFKGLVYVSKSSEEFIKNIEKALLERNKNIVEKRIREAKEHTWEKRVKTLERAIKKAIFPKVSIIILSYNKGELTKRCVKSIIDKSFYPNYEIIIVDNASKDKTTKKILKELEKSKRVKVIYNKKNYGFAGGNNIGMKKSTGDFLIILNNDTVITPGWISRLVYHASDKNTGLVGPVTNNIGNEAKIDLGYSNLKEMEGKIREYTSKHWGEKLELDRIAAFCWIKRREIYEKIGGFDQRFFPAFFEDDDYCLRVKKAGYKIFCAEDVFIHHELGKTSGADSDVTKNKYFIINKRKFEEKWGIKWQPHKYRDNP